MADQLENRNITNKHARALQHDLYYVPFVLIRFEIRLHTLVGHTLSNPHEYDS